MKPERRANAGVMSSSASRRSVDDDCAGAERVPAADLDVRALPDAHRADDLATADAVVKTTLEQHRRDPGPAPPYCLPFWFWSGRLPAAAAERRLQQVRQRVHVAQLAVLDAEQMRIGRAAAAIRAAGAERAVHDDRADHLVHDEAPVRDVDAARHADLAAIVGEPLPVYMPPSTRTQGKPHGTWSIFPSRNASR